MTRIGVLAIGLGGAFALCGCLLLLAGSEAPDPEPAPPIAPGVVGPPQDVGGGPRLATSAPELDLRGSRLRCKRWDLLLTVIRPAEVGTESGLITLSPESWPAVDSALTTVAILPAGAGDLQLPVTHMVEQSPVNALRVAVDLPGAMGASAYLQLPASAEERMAGGQLKALVTLEAACVIEGRVLDVGGGPACALVSVMRPVGSTEDPLTAVPVSTGSDGRFALRTLGIGTALVVARSSASDNLGATARAPGVSASLTLRYAARLDAGTLKLERAEVLRLNVVGLQAGAIRPEYDAESVEAAPTLSPFGNSWRWSQAGPVEQLADWPIADERVVELSGARAGTWRVNARVPGCDVPACHEVVWGREILVTLPGPPGELDLGSARLQISVRGPEGALAKACVVVRSTQAMALWTNAEGLAQALLRPQRTYHLKVYATGHGHQELSLTMPADGQVEEREVTLFPIQGCGLPDWTTMQGSSPLRIVGPDDQPVPAELRVFDRDGAPLTVEWSEEGPGVRWVSSGRLVRGGDISRLTRTGPGDLRVEVTAPGFQSTSAMIHGGETGHGWRSHRHFEGARQTVQLVPLGSENPPSDPGIRR